ncbi:hypothetical protein HYDPIDRAFT_32746 [Hydnomerulius pinastri MD-312]|uniref:Protein SMG7 n=1 Tax=Hydnomerulius pinastri MD-312 TaxID=994086 RepID=A0A0C9V3G5_9AGAM|nr:hypothetical protein HYDPIDRAFT_32746 [Hydnomerulius pinastri MD-312]
MSDSALHLAREAKGLHQGLKELLKTHNPWDKEVEFNRKNLRRQYLRLLLVEPYAKESKDAETHLWMQTSYQFISHYKQSLATLDRTLQSAPRHQPRQGGHGPVEYRKLMQRFRQFLAEEEKFWTQLIARYQRSFALHEAHPILVALNISTPSDDVNVPNLPDSGDINGTSNLNHGRNQFSFPPEDCTPAPDPAETKSRLAILSKAIVCLGDIARYRELYNEGGGRPKAGHEDGTAPAKRGGRNRRGGIPGFDSIPRARNYDKAIQCYEQARLLVPSEGNPSHQLAILAFYQSDMFSSLLHYYRALCVRQPYDTASENVKKILNKALDQQTKKMKEGAQGTAAPDSSEIPPRLRVEYFKEKVVLLHALWRLGSDKAKMNPVAHADDVAKDFKDLVSERILPIDTVSRVVVLSEGALWKHRMIRDTSPPSNRRSGGLPAPIEVESQILTHVITIHRVLLEIGAGELAVPPEDAAENDLAQRITAPFRRTLPALRIASKWLVANVQYVLHAAPSSNGETLESAGKGTQGIIIGEMPLFWTKYVQFYNALSRIFPADRLPSLTIPLDEDVDLRGFLPLRDLMFDGGTSTGTSFGAEPATKQNGAPPQGREKVHPNEEQLMRISDLLKDAKGLAELETFPVRADGSVFTFDDSYSKLPSIQVNQPDIPVPDQILPQTPDAQVLQHVTEQEEDAMTDTGRTDNDDPVGDAFRQALDDQGTSEDEDGEIIVWNPRALGSPPAAATAALPTTPVMPSATRPNEPIPLTKAPSVTSPPRAAPKSPPIVAGTTAQDLLNNVMGLPRNGADIARSPHHRTSSAVQPQFPFGLGPNAPPSIWSTSLDHKSPPTLNSTPMGIPSNINVAQTLPSPNLSTTWSPQHESTQIGRQPQLGVHPSPHFQPSQTFSAISPGHHRSLSITPGTPHHPQAPHQISYGPPGPSGYPYIQPAEHRQSHIQNLSSPFSDPAIISASSSQPTSAHYSLPPYQAYPNGHTQQYVRPGQHHTSPPISHIWGING